MRPLVIAFFAGLLVATFLPLLPPDDMQYQVIAGLVACLAVAWRFYPLVALRLGVIFMAGILWLWLHAGWFASEVLPFGLEGRTLTLSGTIDSVVECSGQRCRFNLDVGTVNGSGWRQRVRLSWYHPDRPLWPGQTWQLDVRLKRPHGLHNPGGFDYESWLFQRRIAATGYVRKSVNTRLLAETVTLHRVRQELGERLRDAMNGSGASALVVALVTGDRQHISSRQWQVFTRTGTIHLVAISGLHIGLMYGLCFLLGRWLWSIWPGLCLLRPAQDIGVICGLLAAAGYAALAGFAIPTQRALIMIAVASLVWLSRRPSNLPDTLFLALLAVLLIDPMSVQSPGFWLSFAAVALIFMVITKERDSGRSVVLRWLGDLTMVQVILSIGLLPLLVIFFNRFSLVAPVANLFAVPWLSFLVVPVSLLAAVLLYPFPGLAVPLLALDSRLLEYLWQVLEALGQPEYAVITVAQPPLWAWVSLVLALVAVLAVRHRAWRWAGLVLALPFIMAPSSRPQPGAFQVDVLDVGQGLSVMVRTRDHALLFDTGYGGQGGFDIGQRVILPYLRHAGIGRLDRVIISHDDRDHAGGLEQVYAGVRVDGLMFSPGSRYMRHYPGASYCRAGQVWEWDGVIFRILHPADDTWRRRNNRSCVLQVSGESGSVLLTADIEEKAEHALVQRLGSRLQSTVLLAPHHGSKTSSGETFIDAVDPEWVVFPVGYRNRFGQPHDQVVARYRQREIRMLRSDDDGMVRLQFPAPQGDLQVSTWRQQRRRFWHHARSARP